MSYRSMSSKRGGAWTKVVIFISLYVLLLESLIEWVVVLYLYGNKHVDSKMAPSLIFALVGSFFTVPLVILHSFLAWQYNRVLGYASQKAVLHTVCTYILRLTTIIWLGASVTGLVVVSQQAYCLSDTAGGGFWQVGVSCALHRAVVIVSVLSFLTVCLYFCSRELSERPYDVWLLGVYDRKRSSRDGSIISASTLNSEKSLKRDMLCVCRHPDLTYGPTPYSTSSNNSERSGTISSIQQPAPIRPTSFLAFSPEPDVEAEYLSRTSITPVTQSDLFHSSISRTPSTVTAQTGFQTPHEALPELPGATLQRPSSHTRNQGSTSSLRRFLPKSLPFSISLSSDPQIRALSEANAQADLEKQQPQKEEPRSEEAKPTTNPAQPLQLPPKDEQPPAAALSTEVTPSLPRSTTMNSADAPEVITPAPLNIHRSNTTQTAPAPVSASVYRTPGSWNNPVRPAHVNPLRMNTMHVPKRQSQSLNQVNFTQGHMPRYTQSQRFPGPGDRNPYSRHLRRNDTEIIRHYRQPGSRRPRTSTFGNMSINSVPGHLDCIRETGASIDELPAGDGRHSQAQGY